MPPQPILPPMRKRCRFPENAIGGELPKNRIGWPQRGGIIAPMVAARNSDVGFIVMMAGSGVPGDQILVEQVEAIGESSGKSHQEAERDAAASGRSLRLWKRKRTKPNWNVS